MTNDRMIDILREGMNAARNSADGQNPKVPGKIVLSVEAYNELYFAAYRAKKHLEAYQ